MCHPCPCYIAPFQRLGNLQSSSRALTHSGLVLGFHPTTLKVTFLAPGQPCNWPSANEATFMLCADVNQSVFLILLLKQDQLTHHGWNWLFIVLPEGFHQIILHAVVSSGAAVLVDDLKIAPCGFFCE